MESLFDFEAHFSVPTQLSYFVASIVILVFSLRPPSLRQSQTFLVVVLGRIINRRVVHCIRPAAFLAQ